MKSTCVYRILFGGCWGIVMMVIAGCPAPGGTDGITLDDIAGYDLPSGSTAARVRGGDAIVYAVADADAFDYAFFLAEQDMDREEHELIVVVPAERFGFEEGDNLLSPTSISFSDDLSTCVIGFEGIGTFVLEALDTTDSLNTLDTL